MSTEKIAGIIVLGALALLVIHGISFRGNLEY